MEKVEAVLGGPLAMGGPGYGALKRGGGERGVNENIRRGGWSGLVSGIFPCFGSLELRGGGGVFLLFFGTCCLCVGGGGGAIGGGGKS